MAYTNKVFRFGNFSFWFWVLLIYVIAALVWWFISLERQNRDMADLRLSELKKTDQQYILQTEKIKSDQKRATAKFIGEGVAFLALILLGAS